jgi:hypothetical protein
MTPDLESVFVLLERVEVVVDDDEGVVPQRVDHGLGRVQGRVDRLRILP